MGKKNLPPIRGVTRGRGEGPPSENKKIHKTKTNTARFAIFCINSHAIPLFHLRKKNHPPSFRSVTRGGVPHSKNKKFIKRKLIQPDLPFFCINSHAIPLFHLRKKNHPPPSGGALGGGPPPLRIPC